MRCPACENELSRMTVEEVVLDVCVGGCGGIWFDRYELTKVDEAHESAGEQLLRIEKSPDASVDHGRRMACPKCPGVVMMRHFSSVKREVTIDECPSCGGFWLDVGELAAIRGEFATEEERERAAAQYFAAVFDPELSAAHVETEKDLESARRVAHIFRFICPSYYIPGKQGWGAF